MSTPEVGKCAMCGEVYIGRGHNPEPLLAFERRVCDVCNDMHVLPARYRRMRAGHNARGVVINDEGKRVPS